MEPTAGPSNIQRNEITVEHQTPPAKETTNSEGIFLHPDDELDIEKLTIITKDKTQRHLIYQNDTRIYIASDTWVGYPKIYPANGKTSPSMMVRRSDVLSKLLQTIEKKIGYKCSFYSKEDSDFVFPFIKLHQNSLLAWLDEKSQLIPLDKFLGEKTEQKKYVMQAVLKVGTVKFNTKYNCYSVGLTLEEIKLDSNVPTIEMDPPTCKFIGRVI